MLILEVLGIMGRFPLWSTPKICCSCGICSTHQHILGLLVSLVPGICAFNFPKTTVDRMVAAAKVSAAEALDEGRYFSTDDVLSVTRCCLLGVEHVGIQWVIHPGMYWI